MLILSTIGILILSLAHIFVNKLNFSYIPRSKWLSVAGGVSVSYIFIHVLPELKEWQEMISKNQNIATISLLEHHVYLFSLIGLTVFYGLERAAKMSKESHRNQPEEETKEDTNVFWIHMTSFSIYNFIIGYLLLHREETSTKSLMFFIIAMAFHFMVNDYGLLDHYRNAYKKKGRWIVTGALILGWFTGLATKLPEVWIGIIFSFIAGAVILNVLKEELPEERKSTYWAFLLGVIFYSVLLLII